MVASESLNRLDELRVQPHGRAHRNLKLAEPAEVVLLSTTYKNRLRSAVSAPAWIIWADRALLMQ